MKCENCTKYDDCRTGSGLTWPCGAYRPKTGGGMDIEKLIEQLRYLADTPSYTAFHDAKEREIICDQCEADFCYDKQQDAHWCMYEALSRAATALSTLQAENEKLKDQLYDGEGVNLVNYWMQQAKIEENGHRNCQAENEKLREAVDKYATAARAIALHLKPFCDESLPYDEMIADAARKASDELEQVKAERDAAVEDVAAIIGDVEEIRRGYGVDNADADGAFAELCETYCANNGRLCYAECEKYHCKNFKWRGQKEE